MTVQLVAYFRHVHQHTWYKCKGAYCLADTHVQVSIDGSKTGIRMVRKQHDGTLYVDWFNTKLYIKLRAPANNARLNVKGLWYS